MRKVILIDDNKAFAKMMAVSLPWEEMGLELCSVQYQGDDALEAIRKDKPDLVITTCPGRMVLRSCEGRSRNCLIRSLFLLRHMMISSMRIKPLSSSLLISF